MAIAEARSIVANYQAQLFIAALSTTLDRFCLGAIEAEAVPHNDQLLLIFASKEIALAVRKQAAIVSGLGRQEGYRLVSIGWVGCNRPFPILCTASEENGSLRGVVKIQGEIDWNAVHNGTNPVYISDLHTQDNYFLNNAAVLAQNGKPPAEFLKANAYALNFEDELDRRCSLIDRDGGLREYGYEAMRWFPDDEGGFIRHRMRFTSTFRKVEYLGRSCWMGEVLEAERMSATVTA